MSRNDSDTCFTPSHQRLVSDVGPTMRVASVTECLQSDAYFAPCKVFSPPRRHLPPRDSCFDLSTGFCIADNFHHCTRKPGPILYLVLNRAQGSWIWCGM